MKPPASGPTVFAGGEVFEGKYEIQKMLGKGGMGEVYCARHLFMDRLVAIKVLPLKRQADQNFRLLMQREAAAGAKVRNDHLVEVHDGGITSDNIVYMVMEYLGEHRTLRQVIYSYAPLPPVQWIGWAVQIAEGLAACHAVDVWHRDVKPENVLVPPGGRLKVIDFGLARIRSEILRTTGLRENEKGQKPRFATPLYASPEQLFPDGHDVTEKTDIWSLATVIYEMAVGKQLWQRVTDEFPGSAEASYAIATRPPPKLIDALPRIPKALSDLVARCHEKDPSRRPTARALAGELAGWLSWAQQEKARAEIVSSEVSTDPLPARAPVAAAVPPASTTMQSSDTVEDAARPGPPVVDTDTRYIPDTLLAAHGFDGMVDRALPQGSHDLADRLGAMPSSRPDPLASTEVLLSPPSRPQPAAAPAFPVRRSTPRPVIVPATHGVVFTPPAPVVPVNAAPVQSAPTGAAARAVPAVAAPRAAGGGRVVAAVLTFVVVVAAGTAAVVFATRGDTDDRRLAPTGPTAQPSPKMPAPGAPDPSVPSTAAAAAQTASIR